MKIEIETVDHLISGYVSISVKVDGDEAMSGGMSTASDTFEIPFRSLISLALITVQSALEKASPFK